MSLIAGYCPRLPASRCAHRHDTYSAACFLSPDRAFNLIRRHQLQRFPWAQLRSQRQRRPSAQAAKTAKSAKSAKPAKAKGNVKKVFPSRQEKWRLYEVRLSIQDDPGKDMHETSEALCSAVALKLKCKGQTLPSDAVTVIRKSFDARIKHRDFVYVVDVDAAAAKVAGAKPRFKSGQLERVPHEPTSGQATPQRTRTMAYKQDPIVIVGSGPAGLFAALELAEAGLPVTLLERGQPVESRGRDIGALMVRRLLNTESNLCYGEGGAGTWSDGKLTTKVGRNSDPVRRVLQTLYTFGAPQNTLVAGKPHLGTDRLVRILQAFRKHLTALGVKIHFGACVTDLVIQHECAVGVQLKGGEVLPASKVVLAVGHSSRAMYTTLRDKGVALSPKPFALGLRVEHPQALIDGIQYGQEYAAEVQRGKGRVPVADYSLTAQALPDYTSVTPQTALQSAHTEPSTSPAPSSPAPHATSSAAGHQEAGEDVHSSQTSSSCNGSSSDGDQSSIQKQIGLSTPTSSSDSQDATPSHNSSSAPTASSDFSNHKSQGSAAESAHSQERQQSGAATSTSGSDGSTPRGLHQGSKQPSGQLQGASKAGQGRGQLQGASEAGQGRGVYSFCMCPGGQIVPTTTNPEELCINGMSFSRRNSLWANAALVVAVQPSDWSHLESQHGALAGVALQVQAERLAAKLGGGDLVAPAQRVTDFLAEEVSLSALPTSSYRLGVRSAGLHEIYSPPITQALKSALHQFDKRMPGFISDQGLLHGVETRTSSPVRIDRGTDLQSLSTKGLYPCGEGAGYAGGIVSAAVDGMRVAQAILQDIGVSI